VLHIGASGTQTLLKIGRRWAPKNGGSVVFRLVSALTFLVGLEGRLLEMANSSSDLHPPSSDSIGSPGSRSGFRPCPGHTGCSYPHSSPRPCSWLTFVFRPSLALVLRWCLALGFRSSLAFGFGLSFFFGFGPSLVFGFGLSFLPRILAGFRLLLVFVLWLSLLFLSFSFSQGDLHRIASTGSSDRNRARSG
jgi:hypothetical protein